MASVTPKPLRRRKTVPSIHRDRQEVLPVGSVSQTPDLGTKRVKGTGIVTLSGPVGTSRNRGCIGRWFETVHREERVRTAVTSHRDVEGSRLEVNE